MPSGRIKKNFTQVSTFALLDNNLSLKGKGLYSLIQHYITIKDFTLYKATLKKDCVEGEKSFESAWKELKDKGYLVQHKYKNAKGAFYYEYELIENPKVLKEIPVDNYTDSDCSIPLDEQNTIDEICQEVAVTTECIMEVSEATGFNGLESQELLKAAKNDVVKVIECYRYALKQKGIKNIVAYIKACIVRNIKIPKENYTNSSKVLRFNDYDQRKYDYDALERAFLYGEEYQLPM